jgi:hypothetical protein
MFKINIKGHLLTIKVDIPNDVFEDTIQVDLLLDSMILTLIFVNICQSHVTWSLW